MGVMFDPKSIYTTMSKDYQFLQLEIFKQMYEKGLIYRDHRVIFWSAEEKRILDFDDLEEKSELRDCVAVKFPIKIFEGESKFLEEEYIKQGKKLYLVGFLPEPWKYVGVRALAFHPENNYCITKIKNDYYICAYKRLPELCKRIGEKKPEILHMARGSAFKNIIAHDPIFNRDLPIILNNDVSEYYGTGIQIISPAHDFISEKIARNYNLSLEGFLNEENYFTKGVGLFLHNTNFLDGNKKIINKLNSNKHLFATWKFENYYYENKKNMERVVLRSIPSWFFKINKNLKMECIKELSLLEYHPELNFDKPLDDKLQYQPQKLKKSKEEGETNKGYQNIVEELEDLDEWCISEINSWGHPIPYFIYASDSSGEDLTYTNKILFNSEIISHIQNLFYEHGTDIWWTWEIKDLLPEKYKPEADNLIKGKENFESWFDSSISWFSILMKNKSNNNLDNLNSFDLELLKKINQEEKLKSESQHVSTKIENEEFLNRTKDHLKSLNNKLREFVISSMEEKIRQTTASEKSSEEQDDESTQEENTSLELELDLKSVKSVRTILPKEYTINHIKNKCRNLSPTNLFPADILIEGRDQHMNWFLQSLMTSVAVTNHSPFQSLKTHGFIQDSAGNKLSKSMRNYIDPLDIIDGSIKSDGERHFGYGSDTLRLFFLKNDTDMNFKLFEMFLEKSKNELKLIRKMAKVSLGLLHDFDESILSSSFKFNFSNASLLDQIIINEFVKFMSKQTEALEKYNFKLYSENLMQFISESFTECYIDIVRKNVILYPAESPERFTHQFVINEIFFALVKMLSPIVPFTCEDIYSHYDIAEEYKKKYIGLEKFPTLEETMLKFNYSYNQDLNFNGENLFKIKREVNKEINLLLQVKNYSHLKRNDLEIVILNNAEGEDSSYATLLLQTLGDSYNLSNFFGVAGVYLNEGFYPDSNPEILKRKHLFFVRDMPYDSDSKHKYLE
jgi:isoleucyl-tRNA synthetase